MPFRRSRCALLIAPLLWMCSTAAADSSANSSDSKLEGAWRDVVARFEQRLVAEKVVGGAIVFSSRASGRRCAYFGVQDLKSSVPVDGDTIFHWASITKTFTAIAATQLAERGLLDVDAPAVKYLPELQAIHDPFGSIQELRVMHLMTHTAGLRSPTWPWGGDKPWHPQAPTQWSQLVAMMPYTQIEFRPGEKYSYSNPGYTFLGRIVEVVSGEDVETYIDKNVLRPLGMHATYFDLTPPHLSEHRSGNYYLIDGSLVANSADFDTGVTNGNGGLNASVADMARYIEFLAGRGSDERFPLPPATLRKMWQPVAEVGREAGLVESMGRGFFIVDWSGESAGSTAQRRFIGHTGTQMGFRSFFYVDPVSGSAVLMALNTRTTENYRGIYNDTRRDMFEKLFAVQPRAAKPASRRHRPCA